MKRALLLVMLGAGVLSRVLGASSDAHSFFTIRVGDEQTGRGVPLVQLKTVSEAAWWTDSAGVIAFDEPGLMGQEVFFHVNSPGYEYPKDFFGYHGLKLRTDRGAKAEIKLKRMNIAERLYRITGQGIYRDSVLVSFPTPLKRSVLNGQVVGQDTVIATPYRGKIYWFWGDTQRASYPLGNFGASGATSDSPGHGGLDPAVGVDLSYFTDKSGFSKPMCPDSQFGEGLKWIEGVMTVKEGGVERLLARVAAGTGMTEKTREWHLAVFNDRKQEFESVVKWDLHVGHDSSHAFHATEAGKEYVYLYPNLRVRAEIEAMRDLNNYEAFTCVAGDGKLQGGEPEIVRDSARRVKYAWVAGADRLEGGQVRKLVSTGKLKREESWLQMRDLITGANVETHRGSVFWNDFRRRWVMLFAGKAGEAWFSLADLPTGPWLYGHRVVTHGNYNFYNVTQDPFFDQEGGRLIYFEGTYTDSFSGAPAKTPRYDYNQLMYRLALDDPRLAVPVPVYRLKSSEAARGYALREALEKKHTWEHVEEIAFFAISPDQRQAGLVPVYATKSGTGLQLKRADKREGPVFFALPLEDSTNAPVTASILQSLPDENGQPMCRVWKNFASNIATDLKEPPVNVPQTGREMHRSVEKK